MLLITVTLSACKAPSPVTSKPTSTSPPSDFDSGAHTETSTTVGYDTSSTADTGPVCSDGKEGAPTVLPGSYTDPVCVLDQTLAEICTIHSGSAECPTFTQFLTQIGWFDGTCGCGQHLFGSGSGALRCLGSDGVEYDLLYACGRRDEEAGVSEYAVFDTSGNWVGYQWHYWSASFAPPCCGGAGYFRRVIVGAPVVFDCATGGGQELQPSDFRDTGGGYPDTGGAACTDSGWDSGDSGP